MINFGKFVSGKILGSTLQITNISNQDQIIELSVDQSTENYSCDEIFGPYLREELPYEYVDGTTIGNSEVSMKCWFIENPVTKDLVKSIVIRMSAGCEKEFIIVMKAPNDRPQFNLASFITLKLTDGTRKRKSHLEKRLKPAEELEDIDLDVLSVENAPLKEEEMRVMLIGRLENPKLKCMRELRHSETDCNVIPLGVKISQSQQKFRIPFKNLSQT